MALLRRPSAASSGLGELADLWVEGLSAPHDASCGCGGMAMPALAPDDIEADLIDYLIGKYRNAGPPDLVAFLRQRRARDDGLRFEAWLTRLDEAPLEAATRDRLVSDLRVFLESFAARGRPRIGICY